MDADATSDPVFAGALRVAQALEGGETALVEVWRRAPLQALARLHVLAAADLVDEERLGRPEGGAAVGRRLEMLADLATGAPRWPPRFRRGGARRTSDAGAVRQRRWVVARGAARLVTIASGLDRHGLGVPEVAWMRKARDYRRAAEGFATGSREGVTGWLLLCCGAMRTGALDALEIAEAGR